MQNKLINRILGSVLLLSLTSFHTNASSLKSRVKRVIGGDLIDTGDRPYIVHLEGKIPVRFLFNFPISYVKHYCGGSLIASNWVLTAAHCFNQHGYENVNNTAPFWHITVGEVNTEHNYLDRMKHLAGRLTGREEWYRWRIHAQSIFVHPQYNEFDSWYNDIALIKLEEELPVNDDPDLATIELPCYNVTSWPTTQQHCIMSGWGCLINGGGVQNDAQSIVLPVLSDEECVRIYGMTLDKRLCAGYNLLNKGICRGDSGSALVCRQEEGDVWLQAGIASFTSATSPGDIPGVFTRVSDYINWIKETMDNNK